MTGTGAAFVTLAQVHPGASVKVHGFNSRIPEAQRAHLLSYGLTPGQEIRVLQHSPVTIVQIDLTELALEHQLAVWIEVRLD